MLITLDSPWVSSGTGDCKYAWRAACFYHLKSGVIHKNPTTGQAQTFQCIRTSVTDCRSLKVGFLRMSQLFIFETTLNRPNWKEIQKLAVRMPFVISIKFTWQGVNFNQKYVNNFFFYNIYTFTLFFYFCFCFLTVQGKKQSTGLKL